MGRPRPLSCALALTSTFTPTKDAKEVARVPRFLSRAPVPHLVDSVDVDGSSFLLIYFACWPTQSPMEQMRSDSVRAICSTPF